MFEIKILHIAPLRNNKKAIIDKLGYKRNKTLQEALFMANY